MADSLECDPATALADVDIGIRPQRMVKEVSDMDKWRRSVSFYDILGFINGISTSIQGKKISDDIYVSPFVAKLMEIIEFLNQLIDKIPPADQPQRFGNKAYRSWSRKMYNEVVLLLHDAVPIEKCQLVTELSYYLNESFGNAVRIDYGTGHELSFMFFLCALYKAELLSIEDNIAVALRLFNSYLLLCRRLQLTYRMEPAGSQGVWSLDDYQFVPFIWGSAQLSYRTPFDPSRFLDEEILAEHKDDYMFLGCIDYISKVKTGHFAEHSNQLWGISAVPSWPKIHSGLIKMYEKEILGKFPVIQHCCFGDLMRFDPVSPGTIIQPAQLGHLPTDGIRKNVMVDSPSALHMRTASTAAKTVAPATSTQPTTVPDEGVLSSSTLTDSTTTSEEENNPAVADVVYTVDAEDQ